MSPAVAEGGNASSAEDPARSAQPADGPAGARVAAGPAPGPAGSAAAGPGAAGPGRPKAGDAPPQPGKAARPGRTSRPSDLSRQAVNEYVEERDRVFHDSVVYSYCNIYTESFTGRDSGGPSTEALFQARVRPDYLKKLADVYEPPACAFLAEGRLGTERLVCLRGTEGAGRTTLAIQLLRQHVADDDVWQIRPHTPVTELTDAGFKQDRGYFLCVSPNDVITEFEFIRLRAMCEGAGCYLVLIGTAERARIYLDDAIVDVEPPGTDRVTMLRTHTVRMLDPEHVSAVAALLELAEVRTWCHGSYRLAEIETVARIVADVARGRIDHDALASHLSLVSQDGIRTWFSAARKELRPLIITLTFFGRLPLQSVLELEDRLSIKLREAEGVTEPRDLFAVSGPTRLKDVSAHASVAEHEDKYGPVRTEIAEFNDLTWEDSLALLLRTEYPSVRPVLISWLRELAVHHDTHVQCRAALTLGSFAQDSLSSLIHEVIGPWASTPDQEYWMKAVWAFTVPLGMADTAPRAARVLEQWAASDVPALVYAAAVAYGMALAPANPTAALSGLARIARRAGQDDEDWTAAAGTGVVAMYLSGFAKEALTAIRRWSGSKKKTEREFALLTFWVMAEYIDATIDQANSPFADADAAARGKKQDWPSLLLEACQRETSSDVIGTAREALNHPEFSVDMLRALRHWFNRANDRQYLVRPLINFVAALAATPHEADRLAYYLQVWADKNPKGAAAQVRNALLKPSRPGGKPFRPQGAAAPHPPSGAGSVAAARDS